MTEHTPISFLVSLQPDSVNTTAARRGGKLAPAGMSRRGTATPQQITSEAHDIVHLVCKAADGNAVDLWLHPEHARDLLLSQRGATVKNGQVVVVPELHWQQQAADGQRGFISDFLVDALELVGIKPDVPELSAKFLADKIDSQVIEGVYRLNATALDDLKGQRRVMVEAVEQPVLVFIHGTFSSTAGSFKEWWTHKSQIEQIFKCYQQQVYGLDHATLGQTPLFNATTLVNALPSNARLHLVSHSRGGLVAECLVRACELAKDDALLAHETNTFFANPDDKDLYQQHLQQLKALVTAVKQKNIQVERLVRVACPAHGTLLAADRLDAYFSVFSWLAKRAQLRITALLLDFVKAVAHERTDPRVLPGIEAMRAESAMIRWLNAPLAEPSRCQLRVVAGDIAGDSLTSWLKTLLADSYYWQANDLVVQTSAMYGGVQRQDAQFVLDSSGQTDHFHYFVNLNTAVAATNALTTAQPAGFRKIGPLSFQGNSAEGSRGISGSGEPRGVNAWYDGDLVPAEVAADNLTKPTDPTRPLAIVLPGIAGSHLKRGAQREWLQLTRIPGMLQRIAAESLESAEIQADGVLERYYQPLADELAKSFDVLCWSYDWRLSLRHAANELATELAKQLELRPKAPVHLVAHSMGSQVFLVLRLTHPELWKKWLARPNSKMVLLGPPNQGSWTPMTMFSGDDSFTNTLCRLSGGLKTLKSRQILAQFQGLVELQASLGLADSRLHDRHFWQLIAEQDMAAVKAENPWFAKINGSAAWALPTQQLLNTATELRQALRAQLPELAQYHDRICVILGSSEQTPCGYDVETNSYSYTNQGDGRVCWQDSLIPSLPVWLSERVHGDLPADKHVITACLQWLTQQSVNAPSIRAFDFNVSKTPERRGLRLRGSAVPIQPDDTTILLERLLAGDDQPQHIADENIKALSVTLHNKDLRFIKYPLLLGHQLSLRLTGSEKVVDELLEQELSTALDIGRYPVEPGQVSVFSNQKANLVNPLADPMPSAVVVLGLGEEGELSPAKIRLAVCSGVLEYCLKYQHHMLVELAATTLGSGGILSVSQCVQALVQGVLDANVKLQTLQSGRQLPQVKALHIVEQYLSRAQEAWHTLRQWQVEQPQFELNADIQAGQGALSRPLEVNYRGAYYDLLRITGRPVGSCTEQHYLQLEFALFTRRARSEIYRKEIQLSEIRKLLQSAEESGFFDQKLARTLFELILPHELKASLRSTGELLLELDQYTAWLPWELLDDRSENTQSRILPWVLTGGSSVVRKLRLENFRRQPVCSYSSDVLVIGDPLVSAPFAQLPGAEAEAQIIAACFAPKDVKLLLRSSSTDVFTTAFSRFWRIIHLAGHGQYCGNKSDKQHECCKTGMVLEHGSVFGPVEFDSLPQTPELVFINCCELGKAPDINADHRTDQRDFAANVGEQLIRSGVRCVVVAAWAVTDSVAACFAKAFYQALLNRATFGQAVFAARKAAYDHDRFDNSWAAYQCYGDPGWRLVANPLADDEPAQSMASAGELCLALEHFTVQAETQPMPAGSALLRQLLVDTPQHWLQQGRVAEHLANFCRVLGKTDLAIEWYQKAIAAEDAGASLKAREQHLNLQVRQVNKNCQTKLQASDGIVPADLVHYLTVQLEHLQALTAQLQTLTQLAATSERYSLLGSAYKRQVILLDMRQQRELAAGQAPADWTSQQLSALQDMITAYTKAATLPAANRYYPLSQLYLAKIRLVAQTGLPKRNNLPTDAEWRELLQLQQQHADIAPDFWNKVGQLETQFYWALAKQKQPTVWTKLLPELEKLQQRAPMAHCWASVLDTASFVLGAHWQNVADEQQAIIGNFLALLRQYAR